MEWPAKVREFLFGCHHRNRSRVFTIGGETYQVCWDCGGKFAYSLTKMTIVSDHPAPSVGTLRNAHALKLAE